MVPAIYKLSLKIRNRLFKSEAVGCHPLSGGSAAILRFLQPVKEFCFEIFEGVRVPVDFLLLKIPGELEILPQSLVTAYLTLSRSME